MDLKPIFKKERNLLCRSGLEYIQKTPMKERSDDDHISYIKRVLAENGYTRSEEEIKGVLDAECERYAAIQRQINSLSKGAEKKAHSTVNQNIPESFNKNKIVKVYTRKTKMCPNKVSDDIKSNSTEKVHLTSNSHCSASIGLDLNRDNMENKGDGQSDNNQHLSKQVAEARNNSTEINNVGERSAEVTEKITHKVVKLGATQIVQDSENRKTLKNHPCKYKSKLLEQREADVVERIKRTISGTEKFEEVAIAENPKAITNSKEENKITVEKSTPIEQKSNSSERTDSVKVQSPKATKKYAHQKVTEKINEQNKNNKPSSKTSEGEESNTSKRVRDLVETVILEKKIIIAEEKTDNKQNIRKPIAEITNNSTQRNNIIVEDIFQSAELTERITDKVTEIGSTQSVKGAEKKAHSTVNQNIPESFNKNKIVKVYTRKTKMCPNKVSDDIKSNSTEKVHLTSNSHCSASIGLDLNRDNMENKGDGQSDNNQHLSKQVAEARNNSTEINNVGERSAEVTEKITYKVVKLGATQSVQDSENRKTLKNHPCKYKSILLEQREADVVERIKRTISGTEKFEEVAIAENPKAITNSKEENKITIESSNLIELKSLNSDNTEKITEIVKVQSPNLSEKSAHQKITEKIGEQNKNNKQSSKTSEGKVSNTNKRTKSLKETVTLENKMITPEKKTDNNQQISKQVTEISNKSTERSKLIGENIIQSAEVTERISDKTAEHGIPQSVQYTENHKTSKNHSSKRKSKSLEEREAVVVESTIGKEKLEEATRENKNIRRKSAPIEMKPFNSGNIEKRPEGKNAHHKVSEKINAQNKTNIQSSRTPEEKESNTNKRTKSHRETPEKRREQEQLNNHSSKTAEEEESDADKVIETRVVNTTVNHEKTDDKIIDLNIQRRKSKCLKLKRGNTDTIADTITKDGTMEKKQTAEKYDEQKQSCTQYSNVAKQKINTSDKRTEARPEVTTSQSSKEIESHELLKKSPKQNTKFVEHKGGNMNERTGKRTKDVQVEDQNMVEIINKIEKKQKKISGMVKHEKSIEENDDAVSDEKQNSTKNIVAQNNLNYIQSSIVSEQKETCADNCKTRAQNVMEGNQQKSGSKGRRQKNTLNSGKSIPIKSKTAELDDIVYETGSSEDLATSPKIHSENQEVSGNVDIPTQNLPLIQKMSTFKAKNTTENIVVQKELNLRQSLKISVQKETNVNVQTETRTKNVTEVKQKVSGNEVSMETSVQHSVPLDIKDNIFEENNTTENSVAPNEINGSESLNHLEQKETSVEYSEIRTQNLIEQNPKTPGKKGKRQRSTSNSGECMIYPSTAKIAKLDDLYENGTSEDCSPSKIHLRSCKSLVINKSPCSTNSPTEPITSASNESSSCAITEHEKGPKTRRRKNNFCLCNETKCICDFDKPGPSMNTRGSDVRNLRRPSITQTHPEPKNIKKRRVSSAPDSSQVANCEMQSPGLVATPETPQCIPVQEIPIGVIKKEDMTNDGKKVRKRIITPQRRVYMRARSKKYQQKKRRALQNMQQGENVETRGRPYHPVNYSRQPFWQQRHFQPNYVPGNNRYNVPSPVSTYWHNNVTPSPHNVTRNLIYVKPFARFPERALEEVNEEPNPCASHTLDQAGAATVTDAKLHSPSNSTTKQEGADTVTDAKLHFPSSSTTDTRDYYGSEEGAQANVETKPDVVDGADKADIKVFPYVPQSPPRCSFEQLQPILGNDDDANLPFLLFPPTETETPRDQKPEAGHDHPSAYFEDANIPSCPSAQPPVVPPSQTPASEQSSDANIPSCPSAQPPVVPPSQTPASEQSSDFIDANTPSCPSTQPPVVPPSPQIPASLQSPEPDVCHDPLPSVSPGKVTISSESRPRVNPIRTYRQRRRAKSGGNNLAQAVRLLLPRMTNLQKSITNIQKRMTKIEKKLSLM